MAIITNTNMMDRHTAEQMLKLVRARLGGMRAELDGWEIKCREARAAIHSLINVEGDIEMAIAKMPPKAPQWPEPPSGVTLQPPSGVTLLDERTGQ